MSNHNVEQMRTAHRILKERGVPLAYNQLQYRCVRVFVSERQMGMGELPAWTSLRLMAQCAPVGGADCVALRCLRVCVRVAA